ncbi:enolase C-terminal domain-like protein [Actinokineospora diospyrosa]|uniref:L-alanine-DL-glutamate epimerase n=1 Tax=Actinokineospora diospyrosa TaxID=103728 RepID=A0ABT1I7H6_9PSEU|nr:enolase C-terminal domain-like protein [Actinokineospora diospyrosa]MCP2268351.1 L-alanine-DL-glutamate epimerase [Actinokineospora diospyrosa]
MRLDWTRATLRLAEPLRISRSVMSERDAIEVSLSHRGSVGRGEIITSVYYGLDKAAITSQLAAVAATLTDEDWTPDERLWETLHPGVRAGVDAALWELAAVRSGVPVHELFGLPQWTDKPTARTVGLGVPAGAAAAALVAKGFRVIKVKAGAPDDVARVAQVREAAPEAQILLDPNGGWTADEAVRALEAMAESRVELVEQPIAPGQRDRLAWVTARSPIPVVADEDVATVEDISALEGVVDGVNIKLAKFGGPTEALAAIEAAEVAGLDVLLGCLVSSSLGLAPAVHLSGHARWVDLDGHLLLAEDPWTGLGGDDGVLRLRGGPGWGLVRR